MIFFTELFVFVGMLFLKVEKGFLFGADETGTSSFEPEVNFGLEHVFYLFGPVDLKFGSGLSDIGWSTETFFIKAEGHGEIRR
jgi:hypothetical protein